MSAGGIVLAGWLAATVVRHAGQPVYDLPRWAVALGVGSAAAVLVGCGILLRAASSLGVGIAVVGALIVASIGTVPVIGVLLLVGGFVGLARARQAGGQKAAVAGGLLVALALPVAGLVATDGPLVRCTPDGASTSTSIFRGAAAVSGSASSRGESGGTTSGEVTSGGRRFTYRCEGERLTEFTRS